MPTATPTPEPISLNGSGQTVTDQIYIPYPLAKAIFTHDGGRNFIVHVYYDDGSEDYLVNKIGNYAGSQLIVGDQGAMFEINADGNWTLNVEPIGLDQSIASGARGQGDTVTDLFFPEAEKPVPYHFVHDGDSNFIVQLICGGGSDYVQNAIGAVDGQAVARFKKGPCLWDVTADGNWVIEPK